MGSRARRLALAAAVAVAVVAVIAGLGRSMRIADETVPARPDVPSSPGAPAPAALTILEESALVAGALDDATGPWRGEVRAVEVRTVLARPLIVVDAALDAEDPSGTESLVGAIDALAASLRTPDGRPCTYRIVIRSAEGEVVGDVARVDDRWALEAPAAPTAVDGVLPWLRAAYPDPGETWLARVTGVDAALDADGAIVVRTDLDPAAAEDLFAAQTIIDAVASSGAPLGTGVRVLFADGMFEWSGLLPGADPYLR